jgi:Na+/H+ antiporter NhaD/arsenite permease-like protein
MLAAGLILAFSYIGIAFTRLPGLNIDRTAAVFIGGILMVALGVLTFPQAVAAIDFNTIALLLGMMLLVSVLQRDGFFTLLAVKAITIASTPRRLLVSMVVVTGVASAFLVNDVVVLLFTPVIIYTCRLQKLNPVPFLIGEAMASNIGSVATITGNPQNVLIGLTTGISYSRFFLHLAPVAVVSTLILLGALWLFYGRRLPAQFALTQMEAASQAALSASGSGAGAPVNLMGLRKSIPILVIVTLGFFANVFLGLSIPLLALIAGAAALLVSHERPSQIFQSIDWSLLVFFAGLFIVIDGARASGLLDRLLGVVSLDSNVGGMFSLHVFSAAVSQLVSNVPLTVLLIPLLETTEGNALWLSLASGATLGGNATVIGAVANIIVVEQAAKEGIHVSFREFLRVGVPVTLATLAASMALLAAQVQLGLLV